MVEWSGKPAYQQVADRLRERIGAGEFTEAGQLPSLSQLQAEFGVSITVAREAVRHLKADGLVVSHQGKAAFLTPDAQKLAGSSEVQDEVAQLRQEVAGLRAEVGELRERVARIEAN
ncbi:winged helix-turn-helix domain-containing protein [Streptomyces sp. Je 1-4]|uniref:winged helix-turn-helix domain-containing protein n=1 Tax=Streptomyces TaxID=1883 RepID=UPI0021DA23C2|nr:MULTISPECIES: winged helix-turn-helix domain-containing protein [unclassified Streptomyces]UYB44897.1 winged helix-turn-helix domain-containing protein [Streptomyces sp. Je 1-4]UZQ37966.1 winged helix-turn-helix domain-containing protein [Streptomyces sp. Je 1-4] [Streptomyces sp. Je 1-4 4N24]UZQ45383.1 winged helix-turn-helix domain-containing protein [Streptomyces sp. Je 1-4] [Streptomyces sp. Je 1-4 4N24_ara]